MGFPFENQKFVREKKNNEKHSLYSNLNIGKQNRI